MTALRTLLGTWLTLVSLVAGVSSATAQYAPLPDDPHRWIESIPTAADVARALGDGRFTAESCSVVAGDLTCKCLTRPGDFAIQRWTSVGTEQLTIVVAGEVVTIDGALYVDGVWVLENVVVAQKEAVLTIAQLHVADEVQAVGLVWHELAGSAEVACSTEIPRGAVVARAKSATLSDGRWRLSGYRVGPWPVPLVGAADRAAVGFLPPMIRAEHGGGIEGEVAASVLGPAFVFATGGLDVPFGAGVGVASQRQERGLALRGMLAADSGEVSPVVVGDLAFGGSTHIRGHFEHPMLERAWAVRRAEEGGFFRDWRATHVGVAAAAGAHSLQLSGSVVTEPGLPISEQAGLLTYGTVFSSGELAEWTVDLEHASDRAESTRHSTTVGLGLEVPIGWVERAWVTPRLDLLANYAAVTVSRGFDASTTLSALATAEAGLAFEGRFENGRHRVAPVVRAGGELGGVQQRQAREGAPPYPYEGPLGWRWATAFLEQSFRSGDFLLEAPVGVFVDSVGDESISEGASDPVVFGRLGAALPRARVDAAAACMNGCERVGTYVGASVTPRPQLVIGYSVADMDDAELALVFADRLTERAFTSIRLLAPSTGSPGFGHVASMNWRFGRASVGLEGRYAAATEARGVGANFGYHYEPLGWGIGVGGSVAIPTEEWAVSAGLRFAR